MNVVYVSPHVNMYGAERSLLILLKEALKFQIVPMVIIPHEGAIERELVINNIKYYIIPFYNWTNNSGKHKQLKATVKYAINYYYAIKLRNLINKESIHVDLVHSNSIVSSFGHQFSKVLGVPHIQHIREFGLQDFNMTFDFGNKFVTHTINQSRHVICVSKVVLNYYKDKFGIKNLVCIYNGINTEKDDDLKIRALMKDKINILKIIHIGRLSIEKRQKDIILAAERLKKRKINNFSIDFYGEGTDYLELRDMVLDKKLDENIFFRGYSNAIKIWEYDLGIMSSPWEAFGRVTIEYMMYGLPVVGVDNAGTKEIVMNKETGLLYDYTNQDDLAEKLIWMVQHPDERKEMGIRGRKIAMENYSSAKYCEKIFEICRLY